MEQTTEDKILARLEKQYRNQLVWIVITSVVTLLVSIVAVSVSLTWFFSEKFSEQNVRIEQIGTEYSKRIEEYNTEQNLRMEQYFSKQNAQVRAELSEQDKSIAVLKSAHSPR